ncbi:hypothetical protein FAUST_312 [Fusarium austroamericanum]|uniref:Uncharacterized protein n=1 Tax=Fusarium austroamericanum TaxID=282268 RepID=A0AAN6CB94_FUSAU|nr:hypothetical protein FAUST_312 [Fusarium austroamericanum]
MSTLTTASGTASRTNLGPLTTTFTYPASCTVVVQECDACTNGWQAQTCSDNSFNAQGVQDDAECWPPRRGSQSTGVALNGWGFYSPGIECPAGYTTKCVSTDDVDGGFTFQFPLAKSETAIGCCPTGFQCKYTSGVDNAQTCFSIATTGSFAAVQCSSGKSNGFGYLDIPNTVAETNSGSEEAVTVSSFTVYAPLFQLHFQSSDLPSTKTGSITIDSITTSSSGSSSSAEPTQASSSDGGLSTGAKAGIGVGAGLGFIALIGVALFFMRRRKRHTAAPALTEVPKSELTAGQNQHAAELHAQSTPQELPGDSVPRYK